MSILILSPRFTEDSRHLTGAAVGGVAGRTADELAGG